MSLFTSSKVLGFENDEILGPTGAVAIPEFNTKFTRQMLIDTQPKDFNTLVRLSGFSHGTDAVSYTHLSVEKAITLLGSTGSIGRQTLEVCNQMGIRVAALAAHHSVDCLLYTSRCV